ncbi:protein FAM227B [Elgaria multicarinata webbii]|uniref:protein FAM227B n=1 Tax=Elgaria multicarinata webbii TaxID=159646 RepID=UPI002FCCEA07
MDIAQADPAHTFEEFLLSQNLDDWPRFPYLPEMDARPLVTQLRSDYPLDTVTKYLHDNAPLPTEIISNLEKRLDQCNIDVHEHAKHVFSLESGKSKINDQGISAPEQAGDTSTTESQDIVIKKKKVKIAADATPDLSCKTVENYKFPGFKLKKLTKLPNHLEPAQLWDSVLKVQILRGVNVKVLKKLFISEASLAILQDCFWWLFLHKFKPDQDEQDHLFDRISDSFVALLLSTPNYIKDPFFQMYPDCLSQAVYVTFCEAFPESSRRFDDEFKDEIMDLIFQWIRGFKPGKFAWKKWNLCWLEMPAKCSMQKDSFQKSSSYMKIHFRTQSRAKSLRFQLAKEEPKKEPNKEPSHYIGGGPDFQRSLFNLGGQSPLVLYYLQMHGISNTLSNSRAYRINHTEICKIPPVSPTYVDVIEESQKFTENLHNEFLDFQHRYGDELARLEEQRVKVNRIYRRMLSTITKKRTESRLKTEKFVTQMENVKLRQSRSSSVNSATKDLQH